MTMNYTTTGQSSLRWPLKQQQQQQLYKDRVRLRHIKLTRRGRRKRGWGGGGGCRKRGFYGLRAREPLGDGSDEVISLTLNDKII